MEVKIFLHYSRVFNKLGGMLINFWAKFHPICAYSIMYIYQFWKIIQFTIEKWGKTSIFDSKYWKCAHYYNIFSPYTIIPYHTITHLDSIFHPICLFHTIRLLILRNYSNHHEKNEQKPQFLIVSIENVHIIFINFSTLYYYSIPYDYLFGLNFPPNMLIPYHTFIR